MKSIKIFSKSQFSVLWWSGTLSSFGDWATLFASVALASYLGSEGGNSELTAVIPIVARIIPALMSSFAGILADRFNKKNWYDLKDKPDVIIIARGGGSTEDLMAFNDEKLAYKIYNSSIPIITAIGHEADTSIADLVSDKRAGTPSIAAKIVAPSINECLQELDYFYNGIDLSLIHI